jgi:hypothetical protein
MLRATLADPLNPPNPQNKRRFADWAKNCVEQTSLSVRDPQKNLRMPPSVLPRPAYLGVERANQAWPSTRARRWRDEHFSVHRPFQRHRCEIPLCVAGRCRRSRLFRESPDRFQPRACCSHPLPPFSAVEGPQRPHRGAPQPPSPAARFRPLVYDSKGMQPFPSISARRYPPTVADRPFADGAEQDLL